MRILVITPVKHIAGISQALESLGEVFYMDDPTENEVCEVINNYDAIFTNPNKSRVYLGKELMLKSSSLKVICTASTGTNHIDRNAAENLGISVLSLTEERSTISRISSTAEHALALTLASLRNIIPAVQSVRNGEWDYTKFIGRQMNCLTIGVVGYGRLGSMYADYVSSLGAEVVVYDPYKKIARNQFRQLDSLEGLFKVSDIISLHVHVNDETTRMVNQHLLKHAKSNLIIVNTSRGEIIDEIDLLAFINKNPDSKIATDVLVDEIRNRDKSLLLSNIHNTNQIIITPHIGGMTRDAQEIAYSRAAELLKSYFN